MISYLLEKDQSFKLVGHIGYSPKKKNSVISNVVGAAAYHGAQSVLDFAFSLKSEDINFEHKTVEKKGATGTLQKEMTGCTPLMLAVVAGDGNLERTKWLFETAKCNPSATDWQGNTALHLAVKYNCPETLRYLIQTNCFEPFQRNENGETAASMAHALSLTSITDILATCKDNSSQKVRPSRPNRSWTN